MHSLLALPQELARSGCAWGSSIRAQPAALAGEPLITPADYRYVPDAADFFVEEPSVEDAKAQKLLFDDAAYVFKWGLHGVWGISNRVNYEAPRDEIDRMWLVTPRKK
jgi:hypothetical protein